MSKMACTTGCLVFLAAICAYQVSGQVATTANEKIVGSAIANKLNELTRPKITRSSLFSLLFSSASGRTTKLSQFVQPQYLDTILLLDSSGSIGSSRFDGAQEASNKLVDMINDRAPIKPSGSRFSLVVFSSPTKTKLVFSLGDHPYASDVKQEIQKVSYTGGSTATALALTKAKREFQQNPKYDNTKFVWIATDGKSNTGGNPVDAANELKNMGVEICATAIGDRVNMTEIDAIANDCVFKVESFASYFRTMTYALQSGGRALSPVLVPGFFRRMPLQKFNAIRMQ